MKTLIYWMLLLTPGWAWAQDDPNLTLNYTPWVLVQHIDLQKKDFLGKITSLEDDSIVLIKNPRRSANLDYHRIAVANIAYLRVQGKASIIPRAMVGGFLGGASFYALSKGLDQSGRPEAPIQAAATGALIGGALGILVFKFREFNLRINIEGRQDLYEANKPGMERWIWKSK